MVKYILTGVCLGVGGALLSYFGNPASSGICVSCFMKNAAGALGLHGDIRMQYLRPELIGFVLGAFIAAYINKDLRSVSAGTFLLRFFVGIVLIIGCAVFIGCPIKMIIRMAAGDLTALVGLAGLLAGVFIGLKFIEGGFRVGSPDAVPQAGAYLIPLLMGLLLLFLLIKPSFISFSIKGAGAQHAPICLSLFIGLLIGALAQRTKFCITAGLARLFLWGPRDVPGCPTSAGMLVSIGTFLLSALITLSATGQFSLGLHGQPSSNESYGWAFLAMLAVGFGSMLIRGCPFRQLVMAGSGDNDAGGAVLGMLAGAAIVQNWVLGGSASGTPYNAKIGVLVGLVFLFTIGLLGRERS